LLAILIWGLVAIYYGYAIFEESYAIIERSRILEDKVNLDFKCCEAVDKENIEFIAKGFEFLNNQSVRYSNDVNDFLQYVFAYFIVVFLVLLVSIVQLLNTKEKN